MSMEYYLFLNKFIILLISIISFFILKMSPAKLQDSIFTFLLRIHRFLPAAYERRYQNAVNYRRENIEYMIIEQAGYQKRDYRKHQIRPFDCNVF